MTGHHAVIDNAHICIYCGCGLSNTGWSSSFCGENHYKNTKCQCGRYNWVRVNFCGSGHDSFHEDRNLELIVNHFRHGKIWFPGH